MTNVLCRARVPHLQYIPICMYIVYPTLYTHLNFLAKIQTRRNGIHSVLLAASVFQSVHIYNYSAHIMKLRWIDDWFWLAWCFRIFSTAAGHASGAVKIQIHDNGPAAAHNHAFRIVKLNGKLFDGAAAAAVWFVRRKYIYTIVYIHRYM